MTALTTVGFLATLTLARSSNKWRIEVLEGANSDGEIVFQVAPEGGQAIEARVAVEDGPREKKSLEPLAMLSMPDFQAMHSLSKSMMARMCS